MYVYIGWALGTATLPVYIPIASKQLDRIAHIQFLEEEEIRPLQEEESIFFYIHQSWAYTSRHNSISSSSSSAHSSNAS